MTELEGYEHRFRRAGLPSFVADYRASEDTWTRAAPVLVLVAVVEILGAIDLDWPLLANLGALAGGLAIMLAAFALTNRLRGRRPFALPDEIGKLELAAFVVVPAVLPAIFGGQTTSAGVTAAANLALLGVLYVVIAYGVVFMVLWAVRRVGEQLTASARLLARAIPLLLLFAVVLFINTEMWQVFADATWGRLAAVVGLLVAVGVLFLVVRVPGEVTALEQGVAEGPPLTRRQRVNVGLVLFVSQALQVLVVSLAVFAFFVAFGLLAIDDAVITAWTGHPPTFVVDVGGVEVSRELLRVSVGIAALSGVYYAITVLTDTVYRAEFVGDLGDELHASFSDRAAYLRLRASGAPA